MAGAALVLSLKLLQTVFDKSFSHYLTAQPSLFTPMSEDLQIQHITVGRVAVVKTGKKQRFSRERSES